jgi:uncharacterized membrane protein YccC
MTVKPAVNGIDEQKVRAALFHSVALAGACLATYELTTQVLSRVHSISPSDDLLGGMWAVIATVFVYRTTYQESVTAAWSRSIATLLGFLLCLVYLLVAPFHPWSLAALIGISALILPLMGRPGDVVTAAITITWSWSWQPSAPTTPGNSPSSAWSAIGVAIGFATAWAAKRVDKRYRP